MNLSVNVRTENQEQPDGDENDGGLPGVTHEPVFSRHPLTGWLVHHMTELRAADEDPGGGGPALPLAPEHDVVLGARGGEQEVREQGVATGVIQRGQEEPGVITT